MTDPIEAAKLAILAWMESDEAMALSNMIISDEEFDKALADGQARAAISAYRDALWQPIETAPKDGVFVLITDGDVVLIGCYEDHLTAWRSDADQCRLWSDPTHWQPLPAPPERAGK